MPSSNRYKRRTDDELNFSFILVSTARHPVNNFYNSTTQHIDQLFLWCLMWESLHVCCCSLDTLQVNEANNISGDPYDGWNKKHSESLQVHGHVVESWTPIWCWNYQLGNNKRIKRWEFFPENELDMRRLKVELFYSKEPQKYFLTSLPSDSVWERSPRDSWWSKRTQCFGFGLGLGSTIPRSAEFLGDGNLEKQEARRGGMLATLYKLQLCYKQSQLLSHSSKKSWRIHQKLWRVVF